MGWRGSDFAVIGMLAVLAAATALLQNAPLRDGQGAALSEQDMRIRHVIGAQIEAFRDDAAARAYGFAAPDLRAQFSTADAFIAMVRVHYRPVYRARNFGFTGPSRPMVAHPEMRIQRVFITDDGGSGHVARYIMQKQPDGSWKIAGCHLLTSLELEI